MLFQNRFYEAAVEGRSLCSSGGLQEEEEEECGEEEPEEYYRSSHHLRYVSTLILDREEDNTPGRELFSAVILIFRFLGDFYSVHTPIRECLLLWRCPFKLALFFHQFV
jgi:hypothetical protein